MTDVVCWLRKGVPLPIWKWWALEGKWSSLLLTVNHNQPALFFGKPLVCPLGLQAS